MIDAVIFDCDGTLSAIEGIVFLAKKKSVEREICKLTDRVMSEGGLTAEIYESRLAKILPHRKELEELAQEYIRHLTPNVDRVIEILQASGKEIYIVSAGLYPAIEKFAQQLSIPEENIFAVDLKFDGDGNYLDFMRDNPLIHHYGKCEIIGKLSKQYDKIAFVGDGANDLVVKDLVEIFIGYGGAFYRSNMAKICNYYLKYNDMLQLLPIILNHDEAKKLHTINHRYKYYYDRGCKLLNKYLPL